MCFYSELSLFEKYHCLPFMPPDDVEARTVVTSTANLHYVVEATSIKRLWKPQNTKYSQKHVFNTESKYQNITMHVVRCYLATIESQTLSGEDAFFRVVPPSLSGEEGLSLSTSMQTFLSREDIFRSKVLFFGETFATCGSS